MGHAEDRDHTPAARRSASAEAAALRWTEQHPDEDEGAATSAAPRASGDDEALSERRSASAEAAALRWREQHPDED